VGSDIELLAAWRAGDPGAGNALLRRHFDALYRFFAHKIDDEVEDLIQRTFMAIVRSKDAIREGSSFRAYMFTVGRNELYRHLRTRRRDRDALDFGSVSVADLGTSPTGGVARSKDRAQLLGALRSIPLDLQIVLELHYWEDMTTAELAAALEVPQGTVKSMLRRAREQLEQKLKRSARGGSAPQSTLADLEAWAAAVREAARGGRGGEGGA
jgi:RNA polymerase sigma factor (sigma-70 family)